MDTRTEDRLADGARAVEPEAQPLYSRRPELDPDTAAADVRAVGELLRELEDFDQRLLHNCLSDAADGWDHPSTIETAREKLHEVRSLLSRALTEAQEAEKWAEENAAEQDRWNAGFGLTYDSLSADERRGK